MEVPAAHAYRPCLLSWTRGAPSPALVERMRDAALDRRSKLVSLDPATQALLIPEDSPGDTCRERLRETVRSVVEAGRALQPEAEIKTLVGDRVTSREQLPLAVARMRRLAGFARSHGAGELVWGRRYSLGGLLETLDPSQATAFVEGQLADLRAYDHEHGTNLQRVLELALDHDDRNSAARAAFMHRNTFRRRLAKALWSAS